MPGFRTLAFSLVVLAGSTARQAHADELDDFEEARQAYSAQEYADAVERFEALVGGDHPQLSSPPLILESRKYLAASYLFLGRSSDAERQFIVLLRENPDYQLDPLRFPREVLALFGTVRERVHQEREATERDRAQREQAARDRTARDQQAAARRLARLEELAAHETVVTTNSRWLAFVPFGVGQFQNGNDGLGAVLAVSEAVLLATSITSFAVHLSVRDQILRSPVPENGQPLPDQESARNAEAAWRITNWISSALFAVVTIAGIVDAHARFVPEIRTTRTRRIGLSADPSGLRLQF
jgi:hypothetical protein